MIFTNTFFSSKRFLLSITNIMVKLEKKKKKYIIKNTKEKWVGAIKGSFGRLTFIQIPLQFKHK